MVPRTLIENAGHDILDTTVALRAAHEKKGGPYMGVEVFTGKVVDMREMGIIDPVKVKEQAIKTATELASMILRIDDVIAATKPKEGGGPPTPPTGEEEEF